MSFFKKKNREKKKRRRNEKKLEKYVGYGCVGLEGVYIYIYIHI